MWTPVHKSQKKETNTSSSNNPLVTHTHTHTIESGVSYLTHLGAQSDAGLESNGAHYMEAIEKKKIIISTY